MAVNRRTFDKAAAGILFNYTHKLPEYFDKIEQHFPDAKIYKKTQANFSNKKPRITQCMSLADIIKKSHKTRIKRLEKNGWYAVTNVPSEVDYPVVQHFLQL